MEKSILLPFRMTVQEKGLEVYGINVYQKGNGEVSHRFRSDDRENIYSASKTFTSVAVGMCRDDGLLRLEDRVISYFPEYADIASPGTEDITLRDLLHMSSGKEIHRITEPHEDWARVFLRLPLDSQPGTKFFYSNACTYMLGRVVEKVSGKNVRDFLMPRLFEPFGFFNPQWHTCPGGHTIAATELYLRTDELAQLGRLLLHKGERDGKRLLSEDYVNLMQTDIVPCDKTTNDDPESCAGYGYQVWKCTPGCFRADGLYGQFSVVVPELDAVVTVTSHREKNANDILRAIYEDIFPLLRR
ncbi:MAG TPA: serine hydrolase [Candidatus Gallacutalibacter pullicola]|uniref:Serine hydrolase n=1 Tax=Candidatus Gallacutalibacter pullicola TaxID=2840830 RepID=A0A9D1J285_9FIRM|nr:serine hydrolase [Candidatus Gallacutalibacter pullicola]